MTNKAGVSLLIALLVFIISSVGYSRGFFAKPELFAYDVQARMLRSEKPLDRNIKVILVDEAALKSMNDIAGRWPWPRAIWSDLLDFLSMGGARAALFDILFLERQDKANDGALRKATQDFKFAYHSMMISHEQVDQVAQNQATAGEPLPADFVERFALDDVSGSLPVIEGAENNQFALPIPGLAQASAGMAVVEFTPDSDNGYRRTRLLREYQGNYFPVLGLAPFVNGTTHIDVSDKSIRLGGHNIPIDANGNCLINMYALDKVDTYSISGIFASLQKIRKGEVSDVLVNPSEFKDSIVFIGTSAVGTADLKTIPMGAAPGVFLHAFLAGNYLQNDFMQPPERWMTYFSEFVGVFLTCWAVMFSGRFSIRVLVPLSMLVVYIGFALFSFESNRQVEMVPFLFAMFSTGFLSFGYLTFTEGAEKRRVAHLFTQYVSKDVLDEVMHNYQDYAKSSAGQKVEITVLFSDIRGFTTMSETESPEKIVEMLNVHFTVMADIILKHNGTIDKYIGDAVMAFWGAPVRTTDHAERAVLAGQEMLEGLKEVNRILKERGFEHEIAIGIGINTGESTIGNIGSEIKKNYTVVGDTVNLASRLESITKEQKVPLIFSEYTYAKIKDKIDCRRIGNVTVKGRGQALDIYTTSSVAGS
jgi:adenylate cyclase